MKSLVARCGAVLGAAAGTALFAALGCGPSLDPPSVVERTRVVAARVSPVASPEVAWPSAGESIVIDWIVVTPGAPEPLAATLVACAPLPGSGMAACAPETIVPIPPRAPSTEPFRTELVVPEGVASTLVVSGAVCVGGGTPAIDEREARCIGGRDGEPPELLVLEIPLKTGDAPANLHPTIADEPWTLAGAAWEPPPADAPLEGCAAVAGTGALPRVSLADRAPREITLGASEDDRERHVASSGEMQREVLQISHFATSGAMERTFSAVDHTTTAQPPIALEWEPPAQEEVPASGLLVRFTVVARDGRGGVDHAVRAACVVP